MKLYRYLINQALSELVSVTQKKYSDIAGNVQQVESDIKAIDADADWGDFFGEIEAAVAKQKSEVAKVAKEYTGTGEFPGTSRFAKFESHVEATKSFYNRLFSAQPLSAFKNKDIEAFSGSKASWLNRFIILMFKYRAIRDAETYISGSKKDDGVEAKWGLFYDALKSWPDPIDDETEDLDAIDSILLSLKTRLTKEQKGTGYLAYAKTALWHAGNHGKALELLEPFYDKFVTAHTAAKAATP